MEPFFYIGLLYFGVTNAQQIHHSAGLDPQGSGNCIPYPPNQLDSAKCTAQKRAHAAHAQNIGSRDFTDFRILFQDAVNQGNAAEFLTLELTWMYRYIHCTSQIEAISGLFYDVDPSSLPASDSLFWQLAYDYLHPDQSNGHPIGRRRKKRAIEDDKLNIAKIRNIAQEPSLGPACVQWLIVTYKAEVQYMFHPETSKFPNPHHYISTVKPTTASTTQPTTPSSTPPSATTSMSATSTAQGCPMNWTMTQNMCYFYSHNNASWFNAKVYCALTGATLAVVKTSQEQHFLRDHSPSAPSYWIGLSDVMVEGTWFWEDGAVLTTPAYWNQSQPSSTRHDTDCVMAKYGPGGTGEWFDNICTHKHRYICQKHREGRLR